MKCFVLIKQHKLAKTIFRSFLKFSKDNFHYYIISILAVSIFLILYGPSIINPMYSDWLMMGGDLSQTFIGWRGYLNGNFMFPIGLTDQLIYPNKSCVILTDSLPLFAIFFKLFKNVIPNNFQYFGLWGLMCFILDGIFALKIISRFEKRKIPALIGASFFLIVPVFLQRLYNHTALAGQWIILLSIDFLLSIYKNKISLKKTIIMSVIIGILCVLIHFYFTAMCGLIILAMCLYKIISDKNAYSLLNCLLPFVASVVCVFAFLGGFVGSVTKFDAEGYGIYSSNLNAFINPLGFSSILNSMAIRNGQGEGFAYLGLGIMFLLIVGLILFIITNDLKQFIKNNAKILISLLVLCLISAIFAISNVVTLNSKVLFTIPLPQGLINVISVFRASGRFMWINVYLVFFAAIFFISKINFKFKYLSSILLGVGLIIQVLDLTKCFISINARFYGMGEFQSSLKEKPFWDVIAKDSKLQNIILTTYFPNIQQKDEKLAYSIADFAMNNNKTLNTFYFSKNAYNSNEYIINPINNYKESYVYFSNDDSIFSTLDKDFLFRYYIDNVLVSTKNKIENYEPIKKSDISYKYTFNNEYVINGYDKDNVRTLESNGVSFGCYLLMATGKYHISITGNNLENVESKFTADSGHTIIQQDNLTISGQKIDYDINLNKLSSDCETVLTNKGNNPVTINSIIINAVE